MKKIVALISSTLLIAAVFSGCVQSPSSQTPAASAAATSSAQVSKAAPVELELLHAATGGEAAAYDEIVKKFNSTNTLGATVKVNVMKAEELTQKMAAAGTGKSLPHILIVDAPVGAQFFDTSVPPIDNLLTKANINMTDYAPKVADQLKKGGKVYGMPISFSPWVVFYNKDLAKQLGYSDADFDNLTLEKVIDMSKKTMALGSDYYGISLSGAASDVFYRLFYSVVYQSGGDIIDSAKKPSFATPEVIDAFTKVTEMSKYTVPKGTGGRPPFIAGKVLFHFNGAWELSQLNTAEVKAKLNWGVAKLPQLAPKRDGAWATASGAFITKAADTEAKQLAALAFAKYFAENETMLASFGPLPANIALLNGAEFAKVSPFSFFKTKLDLVAFPSSDPAASFVNQATLSKIPPLYWGDEKNVKKSLEDASKEAAQLIQSN